MPEQGSYRIQLVGSLLVAALIVFVTVAVVVDAIGPGIDTRERRDELEELEELREERQELNEELREERNEN